MKATERQIHQAFVEYVERKHPLMALYLIHVPNEGKRSVVEGFKQKKLGLRKGIPDLFFAYPIHPWHGMWIEVKASGKKPNIVQLEYLQSFKDVGYFAFWSDDLDDIISVFEDYIVGIQDDQGRDRKRLERSFKEG